MKRILMWLTTIGLGVSGGWCCPGCSAFETGPRMADSVLDNAGQLTDSIISQVEWKEILANADGQVTNPAFVCEGVAGTGIYWKALIQMVGGDVKMSIASSGTGVGKDTDLFLRLQEIRAETEEARRNTLLEQLIAVVLNRLQCEPGAEDEPAIEEVLPAPPE